MAIIDQVKVGSSTYTLAIPYATCSTAAGTTAKVVSLTGYALATGAQVKVKFTYANTAATPTLNVNSTGAKNIVAYGTTAPSLSWKAGSVIEFTYDGTSYVMTNFGALPEGTEGTPTASKGTVSNHSVSITPSVTNSMGYISGGTKTGAAVSVAASELVSGNKSITDTSSVDVTNYATAQISDSNLVAANIANGVTVLGITGTHQGGITPSGTKEITSAGNTDVTAYATAHVNAGAISASDSAISGGSFTPTISYNSTSGKFDFGGSKTASGTAYAKVSSDGYVTSTENTSKSLSATVSASGSIDKVGVGATITNGGAKTPTISRQTFTISGVTDASDGAATTTAPTSGVYVKVKSSANTATLTAAPAVTSAGYGTTTSGQYSATNATATVGAAASADTYIPVKAASRATTTLSSSADTTNAKLTFTAGNDQETGYVAGSNSTASKTVTLNTSVSGNVVTATASDGTNSVSKTGTVAAGTATGVAGTLSSTTYTQDLSNKKKFNITTTVSAPAPSVSAGYISAGTAGSDASKTTSITITDAQAQAAVGTGALSNVTTSTSSTAMPLVTTAGYLATTKVEGITVPSGAVLSSGITNYGTLGTSSGVGFSNNGTMLGTTYNFSSINNFVNSTTGASIATFTNNSGTVETLNNYGTISTIKNGGTGTLDTGYIPTIINNSGSRIAFISNSLGGNIDYISNNSGGTISSMSNSGNLTVFTNNSTGRIETSFVNDGTIQNFNNKGTISYSGGSTLNAFDNNGTISGITNFANIGGINNTAGGIIGTLTNAATITTLTNTGSINTLNCGQDTQASGGIKYMQASIKNITSASTTKPAIKMAKTDMVTSYGPTSSGKYQCWNIAPDTANPRYATNTVSTTDVNFVCFTSSTGDINGQAQAVYLHRSASGESLGIASFSISGNTFYRFGNKLNRNAGESCTCTFTCPFSSGATIKVSLENSTASAHTTTRTITYTVSQTCDAVVCTIRRDPSSSTKIHYYFWEKPWNSLSLISGTN